MQVALYAAMLVASLVPMKGWFAPDQPLTITVKAEAEQALLLTDFNGRALESKAPTAVTGEKTLDLKELYVQLRTPGTYVLYLTKPEGTIADFVGTPLVISIREDRRRGAPTGPLAIRVEPLRYAVMNTDHGPVSIAFYYDVAPHTVATFQSLAEDGFYDGLTFHKVVPGYIVQGGDPRGDGAGGPGFMIDAEFSTRPHDVGVLSMARNTDPGEGPGVMPRPEFANSAGSQFFICLDSQSTHVLDGKYTVFGRVVEGMEAVNQIGRAPLADDRSERPKEPQVIRKIEVKPVTPGANPYAQVLRARDVTRASKAPSIPPAPQRSDLQPGK
jgi:peptidyl-prolyl cis-trans isomerase B (cyclophilin B)